MKYKDIFKNKWFWTLFSVILIYSLITNYIDYGYLFPMEILGLILSSFFLTWLFATVWFFIIKLIYRKAKT